VSRKLDTNKTLEYSLRHFQYTKIYLLYCGRAGSWFYRRSTKTLWSNLKYFTIFALNYV